MRGIFETSVFCAILATGCSTEAPTQPTPNPKRPQATASAGTGDVQAQNKVSATTQTEPSTGTQATTSNSNSSASSSSNSATTAFTLDEAKAKCTSCHQTGGSGASVWSKANGTEADWKAFANSAKMSVSAGRMPPPNGLSGQDKTKMIAFLDKLLGISSGNGTTTQPVSYNFDSARVLCIGCHAQGGRSPQLETVSQWKSNKGKSRTEVTNGKMPRNKTLTSEERAALVRYIDSL
ncbi:cytochrome c [bacterium]|nr:cytochrome c [bacterium]